jgi:hypothetical protein
MDEAPDTKALLNELASRSDEMAVRAYDIFAAAVRETVLWTDEERERFVNQSRKRFEAILAVTGQGDQVDEALVQDLKEVGASAAWAGSPLPQLLVVLRISRDLVVQSAVAIAEEGGRRWGLALSLLLTRVLPQKPWSQGFCAPEYLGRARFVPAACQIRARTTCVRSRFMLDALAPVGGRHFQDAAPVPGRHWLRYLPYT